MSEEKKVRTFEDIQRDYAQLCTRAGHIQYQIDALSKDLVLVNSELRDLNLEGAKLAAEKPAEVAPVAEVASA